MDGSMGGPMGPMMGGMQAMPGQMFVLAPGKFFLHRYSNIVLGQLCTLHRLAASCIVTVVASSSGVCYPKFLHQVVHSDLSVPVCLVEAHF